jgi:uncharacterized protein (TIGR02996 family)
MTAEAGLLEAILADPWADQPRLIFADWLEENNRPEQSEFIRVQCRLAAEPFASHPDPHDPILWQFKGKCGRCEQRDALRRREREFLDVAAVQDWSAFPGYISTWQWRRGFVEQIVCTPQDWLTHGAAVLARQPVVEVCLGRRTFTRLPRQTVGEWLFGLNLAATSQKAVTIREWMAHNIRAHHRI